MLTSKQRAQLRAMANSFETILTVGKGGVVDTIIKQADDSLEARELIKGRVLETSPVKSREAAELIADAVGAEVVQVIGSRFVIYRESEKNKTLERVKAKKSK